MRIPNDSLILIADGRKMLLCQNSGTAQAPQLTVLGGEEQPNPRDRDQKSDLAGQRPAIGTPGQASVGETDYHQQAEDDFARHLAGQMNERAQRNDLPQLIVVAPSRVLGVLRKHFSRETQAQIIAEVPKDLTGHPTDKIAQLLQELEEVG